MASQDEIMDKIYSVLSDNSGRILDFHSYSISHKLRNIESKYLNSDLGLKEDDMMIVYSEFSDAFGIDFGDFLDTRFSTVGDLVYFILSRVDAN
jgi:hypothetical protein